MSRAVPMPALARAILLTPRPILANLARARATGGAPVTPNPWQLALGVLRLWHRSIFRTETVGTSPGGRVRATWRARLVHTRALRLPFLLAEGAVRPWDFTGLASSEAALRRHLMGAHHDQNQFVYDLEILAACHPGGLERLHAQVLALLAEPDAPRHRFLRDLAVFEGYHEALRDAVARALAAGPAMTEAEARDPDISFRAYLAWCAEQPATPAATWAAIRAGTFRLDGPLAADAADAPAAAVPLVRTAADLRGLSRAQLAALLGAGHPVSPEALAGWTYRGVSLGLPAAVERLTWKKFAKTFVADPATGQVHGWNVRVAQDELDGPITPRTRHGRPVTFGPFAVRPAPRGVVLDYGARHHPLHPLARVRDPLVAIHQGSSELLLGWSVLELGARTVGTPSYFSLERAARA